MSPSSPSSTEKSTRRGATPGPHVLRAGGPTSKRQATAASNMPAPPPKVATTSANSNSPDETLEPQNAAGSSGGAPLKDKLDREKDGARAESRPKDAAATSEAANALLLAERDDRIASLQKELAVMEREFSRELERLSRTESETSTFWQAKHSALHQQFLRADTELRLMRNEAEVREHERDELRSGWDALRSTVAEKDAEIRALRTQVRGLKEFVSTSTRTDGQQAATDESLAEGLAMLANGLQNWVITNFRKAKLRPLEELDEETRADAGELLPMFEDLVAQGSKVHLLQSIVSRLLVDEVLEAYYAGLSEQQTEKLRETERLLATFAPSEESLNQWRASTLALIHRESSNHLREETGTLLSDLASRVSYFFDSILQPQPTPSATPASRESALLQVLTASLDLSRLLAVQRAVFSIHMPTILPHQRVLFDPHTMEDVGGEDEEALVDREISCVVFPGLIKKGDESGSHLNVYRNVIAKARVFCMPAG
ncbi:hypothetical protein CC79DRAFT_1278776 [Sarocladium strictum]